MLYGQEHFWKDVRETGNIDCLQEGALGGWEQR